MTDKEKIREVVEKRYEYWREKESNSYSIESEIRMSECQHLLLMLDSLQEEPVNEELEQAVKRILNGYAYMGTFQDGKMYTEECMLSICKAGANWQKENLWKPADGDNLPEIDREVIALLDNGEVVFAHRPPEYWDGKDIVTGKVTRYYPQRCDGGGWNIPNVKYWLDCLIPKEIEL